MHIVAWSHTNYTEQNWFKNWSLKANTKVLLKEPENDKQFSQN